MQVITGKVVNGRVEVEGNLEDGQVVTVLAADSSGDEFTASAKDEAALLASVSDLDEGRGVDGDKMLASLAT